jgi:hypothetical protein
MAVAVGVSVQQMSGGGQQAGPASLGDLDVFRGAFYDCLTLRADALFELTDAVLCAEGPVSTLARAEFDRRAPAWAWCPL